MPPTDITSLLNRLNHLILRSFAAYSVKARSTSYCGPEAMLDLLRQAAQEQEKLAERIGEAIRDLRQVADPGQFPIEFTAWNDVALPRVVERAIELLEQTAAEASAIAEGEPPAPAFHFAKEVVHLTERHLAQLKAILATHAGAV